MKRIAFIAGAVAALTLSACEKLEDANASFRSFVKREYGAQARGLISAQIDVTDTGCSSNGNGGFIEKAYRVNVVAQGHSFSGYACHRMGGPDWRIWFDAGTVLPPVDRT